MIYLSKLPAWNPYGKFIILFNNPNAMAEEVDVGKTLALKILHMMFIGYHCVNVVVAFGTKNTQYELYTGDPYHGNEVECG